MRRILFPSCTRFRPGCRYAGVAALAAQLPLVCGCATAPPTAHLDAYSEAFRTARQVSEQVLIEAASDWQLAEDTPTPRPANDRWLDFDLTPAAHDAWTIDEQINLRLQFWIIAERYNQALLALAEGRSPEHGRQSILRFAESVRALPIRRIAQLGGPVGALSGVIGESIAIIEDRIARRQFESAVNAGAPLVDSILALLMDDVPDFYDLRLVLYQRQRRALDEAVQLTLLPSFRSVYQAAGASEAKQALFDEVTVVLSNDLRYREDQLPQFRSEHNPDAEYTAHDHGQLVLLAREFRRVGETRRELDARLLRYQELLRAYHGLLAMTRLQLDSLLQAVERGEPAPPEELLLSALAVYRQLIHYRRGTMP